MADLRQSVGNEASGYSQWPGETVYHYLLKTKWLSMYRIISKQLLAVGALLFVFVRPSVADTLRIDSWRCYSEHGYQHVVGSVTNIGNNRLRNVMAVGVFKDSQGRVIKKADALIDYDPLMPGQSSPFEALTSGNPLIERCSLRFRTYGGKPLPTVENENMSGEGAVVVRRVQSLLNELGYKAGPEDGILGPKTRQAIRKYKKDNDIAPDGEMDDQLLEALGIKERGASEIIKGVLDDLQK